VSLRAHTAMRLYLSEIVFVVGVVLVAIANGKNTSGWLGFDLSRSSAHCMLDEERPLGSHTPSNNVPLRTRTAISVYLSELNLFCACFTCREREWED
jgi:hypothetical protein